MKTLFYYCEIIKCIPGEDPDPNYEYCRGWGDFENMGISVIGFGFIETSEEAYFSLDPFSEFYKAINEADRIMGFNSRKFDDNLCKANGMDIDTDYDLLQEIRIAAYGSSHWQDQPEGFSYSLAKVGSANGLAKTGSGTYAPILWQDGEKDMVIKYCMNDVLISMKIYLLGINGQLIDPNTGKNLQIAEVS